MKVELLVLALNEGRVTGPHPQSAEKLETKDHHQFGFHDKLETIILKIRRLSLSVNQPDSLSVNQFDSLSISLSLS